MSHAAAEHAGKIDPHFGSASHGKLGMWIFLLTDGMSFAGLLIALAVLRAGDKVWPPNPMVDHLGIPFTAVMTFVLILSSVTMVMALSGAQERNKNKLCFYLFLTICGGLFFLCGQVYEYRHLIHQGMVLSADHFANTFYVVTSFHGCHVFTGVLYLTIILLGALKGKYHKDEGGANMIEVLGLFWHFVDLVWILVFTFVYLIPPAGAPQ